MCIRKLMKEPHNWLIHSNSHLRAGTFPFAYYIPTAS